MRENAEFFPLFVYIMNPKVTVSLPSSSSNDLPLVLCDTRVRADGNESSYWRWRLFLLNHFDGGFLPFHFCLRGCCRLLCFGASSPVKSWKVTTRWITLPRYESFAYRSQVVWQLHQSGPQHFCSHRDAVIWKGGYLPPFLSCNMGCWLDTSSNFAVRLLTLK